MQTIGVIGWILWGLIALYFVAVLLPAFYTRAGGQTRLQVGTQMLVILAGLVVSAPSLFLNFICFGFSPLHISRRVRFGGFWAAGESWLANTRFSSNFNEAKSRATSLWRNVRSWTRAWLTNDQMNWLGKLFAGPRTPRTLL